MHILLANLKLFYQRRIFWLIYVMLIFLSPSILIGHVDTLILVISFSIGMIAADLQKDVLTKAFSFTLPTYRSVPKFLILGIGAILNLLLALNSLAGLDMLSLQVFPSFFALYFLGFVLYFFGVLFALSPNVSAFSTLALVLISFFKLPRFIQFATERIPLLTIGLGMASLILMWRWLSSDDFARSYCGQVILGLGDGFNIAKTRKFYAKRAAEKLAKRKFSETSRFEEFVLRSIQKLSPHNPIRNSLGSAYVIIGNFGIEWKTLLISLLIMAAFFGYFLEGIARNYLFMASALIIARLDLHAHRTLLLPRGRKEFFLSAAFIGVGLALLITLTNAVISGMLVGFSSIMPPLLWGQEVFRYYPPDIHQIYICPILAFIGFGFMILFPKRRHVLIFVLSMPGIWVTSEIGENQSLLSILDPDGRLLLVAASCMFFMLVLARYCRNQDLMEP